MQHLILHGLILFWETLELIYFIYLYVPHHRHCKVTSVYNNLFFMCAMIYMYQQRTWEYMRIQALALETETPRGNRKRKTKALGKIKQMRKGSRDPYKHFTQSLLKYPIALIRLQISLAIFYTWAIRAFQFNLLSTKTQNHWMAFILCISWLSICKWQGFQSPSPTKFLVFSWLFADHFLIFHDHKTSYRCYVTASNIIS